MDGVGISIIERPRPLHNHDTPNPTHHTYTLKCEEPEKSPLQQHAESYNPIDSILADKNGPGHLCMCAVIILLHQRPGRGSVKMIEYTTQPENTTSIHSI